MAAQEMMSPIRRKPQELPALTPSSVRVAGASSIQPSPNRTEAAAAMMHLLSGSNSQDAKTCPVLKPAKAKRRYVRRAPKKVGTSAKRQIKTAWMDSDTGKPPVKADAGRAAKTLEEGEKNGDWRMEGDEVKFFPFREYNRKDKSLGLLCENFLKLYRDDKIAEICLDRAATELGVERRRIYDIVNILESIHLVSRKSKNLYNWHGLASLPTSISAMKQRYAEVQKSPPTGSSGTEYPPIKNGNLTVDIYCLLLLGDRRRGKSLSKLSQMFVQLFLGKEDCIIPLDQAAKQLIQMEDSESEEDRLLKTKIRRLYDVANVLVSVGLIEKLQLSNSRKPVFRWKTRNAATTSNTSQATATLMVDESENKSGQPLPDSTAVVESAAMSLSADTEDNDVMKSSQSCDSDVFDDGSDSQSDASSCGSKRKQKDQDGSDVSMSDGESSSKRNRRSERKTSMDKHSPQATGEKTMGLLRKDANNEPIHPQIILCEQQEQVKLYMQQYIREYVDYLATHQKLPDAATAKGSTTPSASNSISKDIHGTPVSLPSLAGSIQDLLLSESPQSVADIVAARVLSHPRPPLTSPIAVKPEAEANPRPLILSAGKKQAELSAKTSSSAVSSAATKLAKSISKDEERYDAPRNLIMALQPRSQSDPSGVESRVLSSFRTVTNPGCGYAKLTICHAAFDVIAQRTTSTRRNTRSMRKPSQRNSTRDREKAERVALRSLALELETHLDALYRGEIRLTRSQLQSRQGGKSAWRSLAERQARARKAAEQTNRVLNDQVQSKNADWIQRLWELLYEKRRAAEASGLRRMATLQRKTEDNLVLDQLKQQTKAAVKELPNVFALHGIQVLDDSFQDVGGDLVLDVWSHEQTGESQSTLVCVRRVPFDMHSTSTAVWTSLTRPEGSFAAESSSGTTPHDLTLKARVVEVSVR